MVLFIILEGRNKLKKIQAQTPALYAIIIPVSPAYPPMHARFSKEHEVSQCGICFILLLNSRDGVLLDRYYLPLIHILSDWCWGSAKGTARRTYEG